MHAVLVVRLRGFLGSLVWLCSLRCKLCNSLVRRRNFWWMCGWLDGENLIICIAIWTLYKRWGPVAFDDFRACCIALRGMLGCNSLDRHETWADGWTGFLRISKNTRQPSSREANWWPSAPALQCLLFRFTINLSHQVPCFEWVSGIPKTKLIQQNPTKGMERKGKEKERKGKGREGKGREGTAR